MPRLFDELALAIVMDAYRVFQGLTNTQLPILDVWGRSASMAVSAAISWKSLRTDTRLTQPRSPSQLPFDTWHDVIGEPNFANVILGHLVHNT
jgi:hypothetical protein